VLSSKGEADEEPANINEEIFYVTGNFWLLCFINHRYGMEGPHMGVPGVGKSRHGPKSEDMYRRSVAFCHNVAT